MKRIGVEPPAGIGASGQSRAGQEVQVLDSRGCLNMEAMCFQDQLGLHHQAVVERHLRACLVCAQQMAELSRVSDRMRRAKPRVLVPAEVRHLTRQMVARSMVFGQLVAERRRARRAETGRVLPVQPRKGTWLRSRTLHVALLSGLITALLVALAALLF